MRRITALLIAVLLLMASSPAFADGTEIQLLHLNSTLPATTDQAVYTISGKVDEGTSVEVKLNNADLYKPDIGPFGMFYQSVNLKMGKNSIDITARKGGLVQVIKCLITRKDNNEPVKKLELSPELKEAISISFK
ncbi:hypothetical protein [Calorimonas adulescens]|jgi:hypothetical protein|uniref:Uncharacterized protein n=1 Tax=Calorimonas adulescens TaxID=2606906 RepID=A0A5D8Q8N0_9THEO|nr:hypothetical protein [Calorimonas adulescens]TZE80871.1 hypothetical protein FWJ32_11765 [Calorimonas adulescens]